MVLSGPKWSRAVPSSARRFWPQVAPCGTKWPPVATSFIGPRSALVCVCTFQLPPLVATGGHWRPLGFPRSPRVPRGSGLKWPHVAPSGPQWPPVSSVLGPRSCAYAPSSCHHWWPLVAAGGHLVSPGPPGCQGILASSGPMWHQVAPSNNQLKLPSDELNCRSKRRFFDLTPQDCIFRSRKWWLRRGLGWGFG